MIVFNKSLTFLVSTLLVLSLVGKSHQDFWWKNNRIVKQGGYGNMPSGNQQQQQQPQQPASQEPQFVPTVNEQTITGINFDCSNKPTGPNKDTQYCDIYHACVFGKQQKTYGCAQNGERFYYDEQKQKCEFASKNPSGCQSGNYYTPLTGNSNQMNGGNAGGSGGYGNQQFPQPQPQPQPQPSNNGYGNNNNYQQPTFGVQTTQPPFRPQTFPPQTTNQVPFNPYGNQNGNNNNNNNINNNNNQQQEQPEPWKLYVRQNEQFECSGKEDGFYASKWCNVYYRCFNKIKYEFLCAKMQSGDRLWWMQHSTSQSVPQPQAQCQWPCDIGRPCTSPGGVLKDDGTVSESTSEPQRILDACPKPNNNNNNNNNNNQNNGYGQQQMGGNNGGNSGSYGQQPSGGNNGGSYGQPSGSYNSPSGGYGNGGMQMGGGSGNGGMQMGGGSGNGQVVEDNSNDLFRIPDNDNPCQGASDGSFVPNPKYCNVFHVCVKGVRKDFLCAKGSSTYDLWWNDATKQCEWPCKIQCSKQIFGSSSSASDIANMDRNLNPALCGANGNGNNGNNGNNGGNMGGYGNQFTQPPIQTFPPQTQPPNNNNNNNNYGGYGSNNNNNFVTIPAGSYGK